MKRLSVITFLLIALCLGSFAQTATTPAATPTTTPPAANTASTVTTPSYFSTTGVRFDYYDRTLTETTNLGVHITGAQSSDVPQGLWAMVSVDATPRAQSSSAALRLGSRYFLHSVAGGKVIAYANIAAGATTTTTAAVSAASTGAVGSSLLGNLQGGMGFIWRACRLRSNQRAPRDLCRRLRRIRPREEISEARNAQTAALFREAACAA
jgi:hypothetical protein